MGDKNVMERRVEAREAEMAKASDRLVASAAPGQDMTSATELARYQVTREKTGTSSDYNLYSQYPNGVRMTRMEAKGVLKPGESYELEPPPGGSRVEIKNGRQVELNAEGKEVDKGAAPAGAKDGTVMVRDASGKEAARLDPDKTLHVFTKHGEFVESRDGKVTFKSKDGTTDFQSLHKAGAVSRDKFEDYGLSADGKTTRFPNGIEWDRSTNKIKIPSNHSQFQQDKEYDKDGNLTKVTVRGTDGKVLYFQDGKGLHVPTPYGTLTQTADGKVTFESNTPASTAKALPRVEITPPKRKETAEEALERCKNSSDPLCGIEDDLRDPWDK